MSDETKGLTLAEWKAECARVDAERTKLYRLMANRGAVSIGINLAIDDYLPYPPKPPKTVTLSSAWMVKRDAAATSGFAMKREPDTRWSPMSNIAVRCPTDVRLLATLLEEP